MKYARMNLHEAYPFQNGLSREKHCLVCIYNNCMPKSNKLLQMKTIRGNPFLLNVHKFPFSNVLFQPGIMN